MTRVFVLMCLALMLESLHQGLCVRTFDIRWTWVNCSTVDALSIKNLECSMVELPKNRGNYISGQLQFQHDVPSLIIEFIVNTPRLGTIGGDMEFFRVRTNACQLGVYKSKSTIVRAVVKKILQSSNFPNTCPLKGNFTYYINNLTLNPDHFPPLTPEMDFNTTINLLSSKREIIATAQVGARLSKK